MHSHSYQFSKKHPKAYRLEKKLERNWLLFLPWDLMSQKLKTNFHLRF